MSNRKPRSQSKRAQPSSSKWTTGWFASSQLARKTSFRSSVIERLEDRIVLSADPLGMPTMGHHDLGGEIEQAIVDSSTTYNPEADFWFDQELLSAEEDLGERIEQTLYEAHALTGQDEVVSKYGFEGTGQTVVVIDSGIAYEHYALGGGYGEDYRVVGGWDFTESDSDPYDDGTAGGHGTHVAGIIGAQGAGNHSGVATGVDLVGLRVFDDAGNGYFSWVEDALQWVHDNRNAFENEITTVNLSLGTSWNSDSIPAWAMLEDEFAQLEADGIFISVSAGNSYTSYNEQGVSYPAASDHVIPVMSVDNGGNLSYFSQRAEYAIAAPGRGITSTVPDYMGSDTDTIDDDWASMSGTSMAAPYVAGASVLIREAMEFTGLTDIDQWEIYDVMMSTADSFYDSSSDAYYKRLNLEAAIDAIMPADDFGSSIDTAHDLGTIAASGETSTLSMLSGAITTLSDADYFSFIAGATGTATFSTMAATHALVADWGAWASGGEGASGWDVDNGYAMDVVAGETYTIALSSTGGLGYYDFDISLEQNFAPIDLGNVDVQETREELSFSGEGWYGFTAGSTGYFTVEAMPQSGNAQIAIYDSELNLLDSDDSAGRVDALVNAGDTVYVQLIGESSDLDLRLTNAVSLSGSSVVVTGTAGDDAINFVAGTSWHSVTLNDVTYTLSATSYDDFSIDGNGGNDTATIYGTAGDETLTANPTDATLTGSDYQVAVNDFASVSVGGQGGNDTANLYGSSSSDRAVIGRNYGLLQSAEAGYFNYAMGFGEVNVYAGVGGSDVAVINGTTGADLVTMSATQSMISDSHQAASYTSLASGFGTVYAYSNGGDDEVIQHDGSTDDQFIGTADYALLRSTTGEFNNFAFGFKNANAYSLNGGNDLAYLYDSSSDDYAEFGSDYGQLGSVDGTYNNRADGFLRVSAYAVFGGEDSVILNDGAGTDSFIARPEYVFMYDDTSSYFNLALGFESVEAVSSNGGNDEATLYDSANDDTFNASPETATLSDGSSYHNAATGFGLVTAYASTGYDLAILTDSDADDRFVAGKSFAIMKDTTDSYVNTAVDFDSTQGISSKGGLDYATLFDSTSDDTLTWSAATAVMQDVSNTYRNEATGFNGVFAYATNGGNDTAVLNGSAGNDYGYASGNMARIISPTSLGIAYDFDNVTLDDGTGADHLDVEAIDYAFATVGDWD